MGDLIVQGLLYHMVGLTNSIHTFAHDSAHTELTYICICLYKKCLSKNYNQLVVASSSAGRWQTNYIDVGAI